jgi:hypothetical protein
MLNNLIFRSKGTLLCCDFCNCVWHPLCLEPPMKSITQVSSVRKLLIELKYVSPWAPLHICTCSSNQAKYWACDDCAEDMWCSFAGLRRTRHVVFHPLYSKFFSAGLLSFQMFDFCPPQFLPHPSSYPF